MVQEIRRIILSLDEVQLAYEGYQRITPNFLPAGTITSCVTADDAVILTLEEAKSAKISRHTLQGVNVLKPIIRFCIENNIMLPRDGKKSISIEKNSVTMHVELDLYTDMPTSLDPMRISHLNRMTAIPQEKFVAVGG